MRTTVFRTTLLIAGCALALGVAGLASMEALDGRDSIVMTVIALAMFGLVVLMVTMYRTFESRIDE